MCILLAAPPLRTLLVWLELSLLFKRRLAAPCNRTPRLQCPLHMRLRWARCLHLERVGIQYCAESITAADKARKQ